MAFSLKRWLREPLLHFLLAGVLLFAGYRCLHPELAAPSDDQSDRADGRRSSPARRSPGPRNGIGRRQPDEMRGLVEGRIREEILYREALALGLDQDDTIVKRRLAQKMEFLADDVSALRDPSADELRAWYAKNSERFAEPGRRSFRHVYFSTDRRGDRARAGRRSSALQARRQTCGFADGRDDRRSIHVPGPLRRSGSGTDRLHLRKLVRRCGRQAPPGSWQGPIESGLGWHLVFVTSATPGRVPAYDEIEPDIKAAWLDEQRAAARQRAFEAMKAHYEIRLPEAPTHRHGCRRRRRNDCPLRGAVGGCDALSLAALGRRLRTARARARMKRARVPRADRDVCPIVTTSCGARRCRPACGCRSFCSFPRA